MPDINAFKILRAFNIITRGIHRVKKRSVKGDIAFIKPQCTDGDFFTKDQLQKTKA